MRNRRVCVPKNQQAKRHRFCEWSRFQSKKACITGGFTLVELMICLSACSLLMLAATPSLAAFLHDNAWRTARMALFSDLNRARVQAVNLDSKVMVCSGNKVDGCINQSNWGSTGWIACRSNNLRAGQCDAPIQGSLLIEHASMKDGVAITGPASPVVFYPTGDRGETGGVVGFDVLGMWAGYPGAPAFARATPASSVSVAMSGFIHAN